MRSERTTCPTCGSAEVRKHGHDRQGRQRYRCRDCRGRSTGLTGTPFSGYRCPAEIIALAVRRIARDHQHLQGRLRGTRGFKALAGARVRCRAHAFPRNSRGGCYDLGRLVDATTASRLPPVLRAWDTPTADLLGH